MKPICKPCQRFFRPKRTGFYFIEGMPRDGAAPGTSEPENWEPYKLWCGDLWVCEGCGEEIIVGTGHFPVAEHFEEKFKDLIAKFGAGYQVNDC